MSEANGTDERTTLIEGVKAALREQAKEVMIVLQKHDDDLARFGKVQEGTKDAIADLNKQGQEMASRLVALEQRTAEALKPRDGADKGLSVGEMFVRSDEFKAFVARSGRGRSDAMRLKTITSLDASAGAGVWSHRLPGVVEEPLRPLSIRQISAALMPRPH
jgi:hypothetical protein